MQLKLPNLLQRNPTQFHRLSVWFKWDGLAGGGASEDSGVGPAGGCAGGDHSGVNKHESWVDSTFLHCFAQGCFLDRFVGVTGPARQSPRATVRNPMRAVLQKDRVPGAEKESGRTVLAPYLFAVWAFDPTVSVAFHTRYPTCECCCAPPVT